MWPRAVLTAVGGAASGRGFGLFPRADQPVSAPSVSWSQLLLCRTARREIVVAIAGCRYAQLPVAVGSGAEDSKCPVRRARSFGSESGRAPISEGKDARAERQADRCWIRPGLVGCLPPARIVGAECLQVVCRPRVAAPGPQC